MPIARYQPITVHKSAKELTEPRSPRFRLKERFGK
jgi:hypothetical protein